MITLSKVEADGFVIRKNQVYYDGHPTCLYCGTVLDDEPETPIKTSVGFVCQGCLNDYMFKCEHCSKILPEQKKFTIELSEEQELNLCEKCYNKIT